MYVGKDTVYLVTSAGGEPKGIGDVIKPVWDGSDTYQARSLTYRKATAVYFNGFLRISYPANGYWYNNREYWLDLRYDASKLGWYGDHSGLNIGCYTVDGNTIYAGQSNGGKVYLLNKNSYQDNDVNIPIILQTKVFNVDGSAYTTKIFKRFGFSLAASADMTVYVKYDIDYAKLTNQIGLAVTTSGDVFDTGKWDEAKFYLGDLWTVYRGFMRPQDRGKLIDFTITQQGNNNLLISTGLLAWLKTGRIL